MRTEVLERAGRKVVLLGNEAIVRGALEAGVTFVAAYPGTPSSEVPMTFSHIAKDVGIYFEYSSNEKVALESAAGAAWCGVRSLTSMKHFGLNVAADSLMPIAYTGVKGGFVVVVADDPQGWSSAQSEQDTRYYARMARLPLLEPANPQECKELTKIAFKISEQFGVPVLLRTTTKVSHSIGTVKLGKLVRGKKKGKFIKDWDRFYNIRPELQKLHRRLDAKLEKISKAYEKLNTVFPGKGKIGIICSGVSFEYARELCQRLRLKVPIAKITLSHPVPEKLISNFIRRKQAVLVLEELEPVLEESVRAIAKDINPKLKVFGKDLLPRYGEYNLERLVPAFEKIFKTKLSTDLVKHAKSVARALAGLPPRKPVFCPGCPHRSTFYAVKKVFGGKTIWAGDIGCYILGIFEPYQMQDFVISMGASAGCSHGISKVSGQEIVIFIGDSTFFHAGMPPIANLKFNDGRAPLVVVMDNDITAMTGHQPHPGSGFTGMGEKVQPIKIEDVARALGAEVRVASSFNQKQLIEKLRELKTISGPRVLVSRGECRLLTKRKNRAKGIPFIKFQIDKKLCKKCGECTNKFACPAIQRERNKFWINQDLCWGCSVCSQICPHGAIKPVK